MRAVSYVQEFYTVNGLVVYLMKLLPIKIIGKLIDFVIA